MKNLLSSKARFPYPPILRRFDIEEPRFKLKAHATNYACAICAYAHYADLNLKLSAVDRSNCEGEGGWQFGYVIFLRKSPKRVHLPNTYCNTYCSLLASQSFSNEFEKL